MKKTYIQPSSKAIKIKINQYILSNSIPVGPNTVTSTQLSREGGFDFDFDDEEE